MPYYDDVTEPNRAGDAPVARSLTDRQRADQRTVAAVDLGSNSFHMVVARAVNGQLHIIDRLKETVRLAAGLGEDRNLSTAASERALACLERFGQRLRRVPSVQVRAVGTNTLRRARPLAPFLEAAETALGHPIDVIYGVEEARLIYSGVTLDLGTDRPQRLVVDIGGGSSEIVVGHHTEPRLLESLSLGAVSHSQRFFPNGKISKSSWRDAVLDARLHVEPIARRYRAAGWDIALGASGSIKAIQRVCAGCGWAQDMITRTALTELAARLIKAGSVKAAKLPTLNADRRPIFAGAAAVLTAIFEGLDLQAMHITDKALREGILLELAGRPGDLDLRRDSIAGAQQRYSVDRDHADRVAATARQLLDDTGGWLAQIDTDHTRLLYWACQLHEIGLAIAHKGYHKHGSYIVRNADLHGFGRSEQDVLAALVRLHRGKFRQATLDDIPNRQRLIVGRLALLLRIAVLLHRGRDPARQVPVRLVVKDHCLRLDFDDGWLAAHPLTGADLAREREAVAAAGYELDF